MEENKETATNVQGTKEAKATKKPSATYCLTQFNEMIDKLTVLKLIDEKDAKTMAEIRGRAKAEYIKNL